MHTFNHHPQSRSQQSSFHPSRSFSPAPLLGQDTLGFVLFHDRAFVVARPAPVYAPWLAARAAQLHIKVGGERTNLTAGIQQSTALLRWAPPGVQRRMWVLSDGEANVETDGLMRAVEEARQAYININCVGFGDKFDEPTLRKIAAATYAGKFVPVKTLRELTNAFTVVFHSNGNGNGNGHHRYHPHRAETTILCIDASLSMTGGMEGKRKIDVVEEAVQELIRFKCRMFS